MENNKNSIATIIIIFLAMTLSAVVESKGIFIPLFKRDFSINDTSIGFMLTISSIGYILFTYIGGGLCERVGQKRVFILGALSIIISLLLLYITYSYKLLLISMFILNIGLSLIAIAINTLVPVLFVSFQALLMNLTHFCYGFGSALAQRVTGILVYNGVDWRKIYLGLCAIYIVVFVAMIFVHMPEPHIRTDKDKLNKREIFKNKLIYFFMFALGFYVFSEVGTSNWFVNYIKKIYSFDDKKVSVYLALFFGVLTLGRLVGGIVVEKIGYLKSVIFSLTIALVLYITGIVLGEPGLYVVSVSGFFFSIAFPTVVLSISKVFKENSAYITGMVITGSSFVNMLLNMFMGYLNDSIGIYKAFFIIPMSLMMSIIFIYLIFINTKKKL